MAHTAVAEDFEVGIGEVAGRAERGTTSRTSSPECAVLSWRPVVQEGGT